MKQDGAVRPLPSKQPSPRRGVAREEAILTAAFELIAEIGYERITVDQIAARARASKSTMYRRWPGGKAELVAEALRRNGESHEMAGGNTGSIRGDLVAAVAGIADTINGTSGGPSLVGLVEGIRDDPMLRELIRRQLDTACKNVGQAICHNAMARGERPALPSAAPVLRVAIAEILMRTLLNGSPPGRTAQRRLVDSILLPLLDPTAVP